MANHDGGSLRTRKQGGLAGVSAWGAGLSALLLAAGCASNAGSEGGSGEDGLICGKCSVAGGETSDFGSTLPPTACQLSEVGAPIDEAGARALGFGAALDLYTRSFTAPFAWTGRTSDELGSGGAPAQGYSADPTSITMQTSIAEITHLVPALAGCADHLRVRLHVSLSTADGAISVSGDELNADAKRAASSSAWGRLDLRQARGSLELHPPAWPDLVGYFSLLLHFDPEAVRGAAWPELIRTGTENSDVRASYRPLDGRFPIDDCNYRQRFVNATDPSATPGGKSVIDFITQLNTGVLAQQGAHWSSGEQTQVHASVGIPEGICQNIEDGSLQYFAPLDVVSSDGRINLHVTASGYNSFDATGAPDEVIFSGGGIVSAQELTQTVGISGVDLGGRPSAFWDATVRPFSPNATAVGGKITVAASELNSAPLTDDNGNYTGPNESLIWP